MSEPPVDAGKSIQTSIPSNSSPNTLGQLAYVQEHWATLFSKVCASLQQLQHAKVKDASFGKCSPNLAYIITHSLVKRTFSPNYSLQDIDSRSNRPNTCYNLHLYFHFSVVCGWAFLFCLGIVSPT